MELDTNLLTLLALIGGLTWWKARDIAAHLRARAIAELQQADRLEAEAETLNRPLPFVERGVLEARARLSSKVSKQLEAVQAADESFDLKKFLAVGCLTYEAVVTTFASGERETLRRHVSPSVYETFLSAIEAREESGAYAELALIGIKRADIVGADIFDDEIEITLDIESEIVSVMRDRQGRVIAGDPVKIIPGGGRWTFAKKINAGISDWRLIATESAQTVSDAAGRSNISDHSNAPGKIPGVGAMGVAAEPRAHL